LGNRHVVCPWLPEERRKSADDYRRLAESLNRAGGALKDNGLQLSYHNHAFELERLDGVIPLDLLFEETDQELVKGEIDTYWLEYAGANAVEYIRSYAVRFLLVLFNDMEWEVKLD